MTGTRRAGDGFEGTLNRNLQSALKDAMDLSNADYDTLEDIADGLERMLHSWNDVQERRAHEYAKLKESLAMDKGTTEMKGTLEDIGIKVSQDTSLGKKVDPYVGLVSASSGKKEEESGVTKEEEPEKVKWLPEWTSLLGNGDGADSDRSSSKRKVGMKNPFGVKTMPLKKKPRKQTITVQIHDDKAKDGECTCEETDSPPREATSPRKRWSPLRTSSSPKGNSQLKRQVEELQIALLESATEYELKILQMKMQMLQSKNETAKQQPPSHSVAEENQEGNIHAVDCTRKQLSRLQREKQDLTQELYVMRKRERMFEQQRKVLEDAQYRVNCLKRELMKKEGQLVNSQLREKAASARAAQLEDMLSKSEVKFDTSQIWSLLPEIHNWLQSIRKEGPTRLDQSLMHQVQHYEAQIARELENLQRGGDDAETSSSCTPYPSLPISVPVQGERPRKKIPIERPIKPSKGSKKEAQALQKELHKLARQPKPGERTKQLTLPEPRAVARKARAENLNEEESRRQMQRQGMLHLNQSHLLYGAALLLGGLLFKNRML